MPNREERRHPEQQQQPQPPPAASQEKAPEDIEARTKSHRHKKVTADKWNQ